MEETLIAFSRATHSIQMQRGSVLFSDQQQQADLYYLSEGYAKLFALSAGKRETLYSVVGPGCICGILTGNGHSHSSYSARMITDGVALPIPKSAFTRFCKSDSRAWRWLAEREARRRASLEKRIEIMCLPDVERRLVALIPYLINDCGFSPQADGSYILPLLQSDFAGFVGATRETTSAMLNVLARRDLVQLLRGRVVIPDLAALQRS